MFENSNLISKFKNKGKYNFQHIEVKTKYEKKIFLR